MIEYEKAREIFGEANVETFIQKIKELPFYTAYKKAVESGIDGQTDRILAISVMLYMMADEEFSFMMRHVAKDLLFTLADQKLRAEILEEK